VARINNHNEITNTEELDHSSDAYVLSLYGWLTSNWSLYTVQMIVYCTFPSGEHKSSNRKSAFIYHPGIKRICPAFVSI